MYKPNDKVMILTKYPEGTVGCIHSKVGVLWKVLMCIGPSTWYEHYTDDQIKPWEESNCERIL